MDVTARDVMETAFFTIQPHMTISEAARIFKEASKVRMQRAFGLIVTDGQGRLVGMLSIYDILNLLRPKHIHIWGEMHDIDLSGYLEEACRRAKPIQVGDIMTPEIVSVGPETHLLMVVDIMIKKQIRRVPVVETEIVIGVVYASTVFYHLLERLVNVDTQLAGTGARSSALCGLKVREAMRRPVVHLERDTAIVQAIKEMIRFKVNSVVVANEKNETLGVVSRTDILGAYYGGLPIDIPLEHVMVSPVIFCDINDSLDAALDKMRDMRVSRLFVCQDVPNRALGVLAYPDILGLLYRYCHKCPRSMMRPKTRDAGDKHVDYFRVCELMTPSVHERVETDSILKVMEKLLSAQINTVLIRGETGIPVGVVSTTDFVIAYLHGIPPEEKIRSIMSFPVRECNQDDPLVTAIRKMVLADIHNLYVYREHHQNIVGVLSLADIAKVRSGSCRACLESRKIDAVL
jgi:CBS domain-containing protein